jgi:hypothetical protein
MRRTAALAALIALVTGCNEWRVFFPSHDHDTVAPPLPADLANPAILVFTKTNGFRHEEAIPAGVAAIESIARRRGWSVHHTENGAVHNPGDLARFAAVVWHNTSGDVLDEAQREALRRWIEAGGGWVGVHGAGGDASYDWRWYVEELVGAQFIGHTMGPQFQKGTLIGEDASHPATRHLASPWIHEEEWYSFDRSVRERPDFQVLARVDESTYSPRLKLFFMDRDIAMGDHPIVWSHCVGRGRALFSALGHQASAYAEPELVALLEGAIAWAARIEGEGCGA